MKLTRRVLDRTLVRSSARVANSFACSALLASALRAPLRSFARLLTHSLPSSWERGLRQYIECVDFIQFQPTVRRLRISVVSLVVLSVVMVVSFDVVSVVVNSIVVSIIVVSFVVSVVDIMVLVTVMVMATGIRLRSYWLIIGYTSR